MTDLKTIAIRVELPVHAQLVAIAQLEGITLTDELHEAVRFHLERKRTDGSLTAKAATALTEIEEEAARQRQAIEALMAGATPATAAPKGKAARTEGSDQD